MLLSKRNRRGIFWLLLIIILIAITPRLIRAFSPMQEPIISFEEMKEIHKDFVVKKEKKKKSRYSKKKKRKFSKPKSKVNPNDLSQEDWEQLGLSKKQAAIVLKFSQRGLQSNEDLQKIFVFPEELFTLIKDSLYYPVTSDSKWEKNKYEKKEYVKKEVNLSIDINSVSAQELEVIPGIGPFFANKIVEQRDELGGYISKEQLLEIWKFDQEKLDAIDEYIILKQVSIHKMNINTASLDRLKRHPYISYSIANSIVKMREMNGGFATVSEIKKSKLINEELFQKILPYIITE
ncbi:MAG TPA: helix-hairpin-helix domain-containing protein [Crocinitomicaceae bacterium]|nr:helix-hairpin-helix domain-containing protein [Crocinitomicaceae bacterium]